MSRNLGRMDCAQCVGKHEDIKLEEDPRPATEDDIPKVYWKSGDYDGLIVAKAKCMLCHTLYIAWVDWPGYVGFGHWHLTTSDLREGIKFKDLSYRHSFDDEPDVRDLPVFEVEVIYKQRPIRGHWYLEHADPEKRKVYEARAKAECAKKGFIR